jgi:curved DNA-binding protein CbpA
MVPDPYKALNLPHSATLNEIKRSYFTLARQHHPDRLTQASTAEQAAAQTKFADIAAAYALLSDGRRKADYDHIYKYGGYDDDDNNKSSSSSTRQQESKSPEHARSSHSSTRKRKDMGVGYACYDPLAFLWTQGRVHSTKTVAGIQVPTRMQMTTQPNAGLRFAFSSGQYTNKEGTRKLTSHTTQFAHGKKFTHSETTVIHADGRTEVVVERHAGNNDAGHQRRSTTTAMGERDDREPWYMHAWNGLKDKLLMCHNPCAAVAAQ